MSARCSICGAPLREDDAAFGAGGRVLFHPCGICAGKTRELMRGVAGLLGDKVKRTVRDVVPPDIASAMSKAIRIGKVIAEED